MTEKSYKFGIWTGLLLAGVLVVLIGGVIGVASAKLSVGQAARIPPSDPVALATEQAAASATSAAAQTGDSSSSQGSQQASAGPTSTATPSQRTTILVMGTDNRPGEPVGRTDTIMLLTFDTDTGSAGMISMARDLLVAIPGKAQKGKINTAHLYGETENYPGGGPALLSDTIGNLFGHHPDYWVRINFEGFRSIIDQIGGIDVDVPTPINDPLYPDDDYGYDPLYIPAGRIHMDGKLALKFARTRHSDSDYGRARRQQQVVSAVKEKIFQPDRLAALLPRLPGLAVTLAKSVQSNMPVTKAIDLARTVSSMDLGSPKTAVIDDSMGLNAYDATWGFVLVPDMKKVRVAVAKVFDESPGAQISAEATDQVPVVEDPRIAVLNATTQRGLASSIALRLFEDGYRVVGTGNAADQSYDQTFLIVYGDAAPITRDALARKFGITPDRIRSAAPDAYADMALVIGSDYSQSEVSLQSTP